MSGELLVGHKSLRLLFVTGKGGIGKSLCAASIARQAAAKGLKVWLVEQTHHDQLGPLFGSFSIGHEGVDISTHLRASNLTLSGNFRDFVVKHLKLGSLFEMLASQKIVHSFFGAIPGFAELMFLGRVYYALVESQTPVDLVVVDAYASGHFLNLMTTPKAVLDSGMTGPIVHETEKVLRFLQDPQRVAALLVGTLEDLVVSEICDFVPKLNQQSPTKVKKLILNRVTGPLWTTAADACFQERAHDDALGSSKPLQLIESFSQKRVRESELLMKLENLLGETAKLPAPEVQRMIWQVPEFGFVDEPIQESVWTVLSKSLPLKIL